MLIAKQHSGEEPGAIGQDFELTDEEESEVPQGGETVSK
jgi:hypothetical protein